MGKNEEREREHEAYKQERHALVAAALSEKAVLPAKPEKAGSGDHPKNSLVVEAPVEEE